ncbi:hypothetical protein CHLNCDRAFT_57377 [Chlorella variabilis]|uniref:Uncharacterized protein n=1 Tax=Chlorella variabilis TaxID=554065 RepID=E1ZB57_CHLVA|nr:hypothetical protein CHLNCDRAFT_57377 [Chlorella variabilis]EFN56966.1 hypothetical protein CHLNCDRAFT_57377 [Chlorella variabilis]|eukprot:XP_005849068.1 hypothetical protein CHLNCDRAFT_57377 [Chlorella variabilis]
MHANLARRMKPKILARAKTSTPLSTPLQSLHSDIAIHAAAAPSEHPTRTPLCSTLAAMLASHLSSSISNSTVAAAAGAHAQRGSSLTSCPAQARQRSQPRQASRRPVQTRAQGEGLADSMKRMAKQVTGALPIIGLISRLTATEGGIGNDAQAYPEYCRQVFDAAPLGFQVAVAELQTKYGKAAQRRYVLLALWMARHGAGVVPGKAIVDAARRLRVSSDLEFEMERFSEALAEQTAKYTYMERPRGSLAQQADVAVDAVVRLVLGLKDGQPVPAEDAALVEECVAGGFWDVPGFKEEVCPPRTACTYLGASEMRMGLKVPDTCSPPRAHTATAAASCASSASGSASNCCCVSLRFSRSAGARELGLRGDPANLGTPES